MKFGIKLMAPLCAISMSLAGANAQEQNADTDYQQSTNNVLAALGVAPIEQDVVVEGDLLEIVGQAMARGESTDYINALVLEAHSEGQIDVPETMTDSAGEVDSAAMLAAVVNAAIAGQEALPASEATALINEAQTGQTDDGTGQTYTVKAGDTLREIALSYFGNMDEYRRILNANPDITNANLIHVGQVLQIP